MSIARDPALYRPNVGIALFNARGEVFYGRRVTKASDPRSPFIWQMPQGGIDKGETPRMAALREMHEEIGVDPKLVEILDETIDWIFYDFPPDLHKSMGKRSKYLGQKQKWFALRFLGQDNDIRLDLHTPEFDAWRWGALTEAPDLIIPFKRPAYEEIVQRFARHTQGSTQ